MYYILHHGHPVLEPDVARWSRWFETHTDERIVGRTDIADDCYVSTVFLGLDHSFVGGPPVLYETMIFGGPLSDEQWRYHTRDEAEAGHAAAVEQAKAAQQS